MAARTILGIEASCDDTAAAVVRVPDNGQGPGEIVAERVLGQADLHAGFGGVVPEIAARAHAERLDTAVAGVLESVPLTKIDAIAVTAGPGLIGGVLSGVMLAKGLAAGTGLPLIGINHLEGHALTPRLTDGIAYPYLLLLVSGGHCLLVAVEGLGRYRRLGSTIDDAPGEAFDKLARGLGLGFPGGPVVEARAKTGDATRFTLPRSVLGATDGRMSFSGLKTAAVRVRDGLVEAQGGLYQRDIDDLCAGFQAAVAEVLAIKTAWALARFTETHGSGGVLAVAGGVAANATLRAALEGVATEGGSTLIAPPLRLCTDNAAMIAWAGGERLLAGAIDPEVRPRPRWPLDTEATPLIGSGRKGAKA
ncbi:MAG: tRNA (adenosine(37)-N6)-threonylcarbamoyltransferase complex transferase subunit TsaD [Pseudomonadota bacterium]